MPMTRGDKIRVSGAVSKPGTRGGNDRILICAAIIVCLLALSAGAYLVIIAPGAPGVNDGETIAVPGHPDWYRKTVNAYYGNGTPISIVENNNALDPVYGQLISFLMDDPTEQGIYRPEYVCSGFAVDLHDQAEISNIRAHIVLLSLSNAPPHMVVMFNTTDAGAIYVDDTGLTQDEADRNLLVADRTVNMTVGAPYIRHFLPPFDFDEDPGWGIVTNVSIIS
jgi:hypothetical protein